MGLGSLIDEGVDGGVTRTVLRLRRSKLVGGGSFVRLAGLSDVFQRRLGATGVGVDRRVLLCSGSAVMGRDVKTLPAGSLFVGGARLCPVNAGNLRFVRMGTGIPFSSFVRRVLRVLVRSVLLAVVVLKCIVFLIVAVRGGSGLFGEQRTDMGKAVRSLGSPLGDVVALVDFVGGGMPSVRARRLIRGARERTRGLIGRVRTLLVATHGSQRGICLRGRRASLMLLMARITRRISVRRSRRPRRVGVRSRLGRLGLVLSPLCIEGIVEGLIRGTLGCSSSKMRVVVEVSGGRARTVFAMGSGN